MNNYRKIVQSLGGPKKISELTGLSLTTLYQWQTGIRTPTKSGQLLLKLFEALNKRGILQKLLSEVNDPRTQS